MIGRLFNTVGPRQSAEYGMVLPTFIERALAGEPIDIHGDGTQTRCFCHVSDVVRALRGLMDTPAISAEIFNVGSHNKITIGSLAERVLELTGSSSELGYIPYDRVYGTGSRTCSTASRRSRRSTGASAGSPSTTWTASSATSSPSAGA